MNNELLTVLECLEQERGVSRGILIDAIEKALMSAGRKSIHPANELRISIHPKTAQIQAWATLEVVDTVPTPDQIVIEKAREKFPNVKLGDKIEWEVTPGNFGRIAAQTAKQAILTHLRKAEKGIVQDEYQERVGEILNGIIKRFESGNLIVDFHKTEGILSAKDRIHGEHYMVGDRINALLLRVDIVTAGPSLILSRSSPDFVKKLFEREVAEMHDHLVEIKAISRDAGNRTKMAVWSNDEHVDPVGACVGRSGMRVKNITTELGGERIDIIPWNEDICKVVKEAIKPANADHVELAEDGNSVDVFLSEDESRKAYGRKAMNLKLAQRLVGRQINLIVASENEKEDSFEAKQSRAINALANELGIDRTIAEKLVSGGFLSVEQLRDAETTDIEAVENLSEQELSTVLAALNDINELEGDKQE